MKRISSFILTLVLVLSFSMTSFASELPHNQSNKGATSIPISSIDDNAAVGVAETESFTLQRVQMTENQKVMYDKMLSDTKNDLEVGESMLVGTEADGSIYITCTSSRLSETRGTWKTSYKDYNITKTILNKETLLATVNLECSWYANGIDGYIQNLKGTYTEKNSDWACSWDSFKKAESYNHALFLNIVSLGSSYSIMLAANYNPFASTLSFDIQ